MSLTRCDTFRHDPTGALVRFRPSRPGRRVILDVARKYQSEYLVFLTTVGLVPTAGGNDFAHTPESRSRGFGNRGTRQEIRVFPFTRRGAANTV